VANHKTTPEIRFKDFSDDWEHLEFRDLGSVVMNKRIFKDQTSEVGDVPFYKIGTFGGKPDAFISRQLFEEYKNKFSYPKIGDVLLSASGSIGRIVEYTGADEYFQDSNIVWLEHDERLDNLFLKHFYSIVKWQGLEGSTIKRLYNKNILDTEINLPSIAEQQKIGDFFKNIDNLIHLHQRKYEKLVTIKKAMLEKMFPKNGSNVPEIRFKGFSDDWDMYKLQEVATMKARIGWQGLTQKEFLNEGNYYLITGTDFGKGIIDFKNCHYIGEDRYNQDINIQIKNDDVLITKDGTIGKVVYVENMDKPTTLNAGIFVIRGKDKNIHNLYLYHYLAAPFLLDYADKQATGGTIKHLNQNVLVNFPIPMPKTEEQQKIGAFFKDIDGLINLHQRKYEKLVTIKKALLEKMFV
jgi:type I restriction enzyme S subunit